MSDSVQQHFSFRAPMPNPQMAIRAASAIRELTNRRSAAEWPTADAIAAFAPHYPASECPRTSSEMLFGNANPFPGEDETLDVAVSIANGLLATEEGRESLLEDSYRGYWLPGLDLKAEEDSVVVYSNGRGDSSVMAAAALASSLCRTFDLNSICWQWAMTNNEGSAGELPPLIQCGAFVCTKDGVIQRPYAENWFKRVIAGINPQPAAEAEDEGPTP